MGMNHRTRSAGVRPLAPPSTTTTDRCGDDLVGEPCDGHAGLAAGRRPRCDRDVVGRRAARPHRLGRGAGDLGRVVLGRVGRERDLVPRARPVGRRRHRVALRDPAAAPARLRLHRRPLGPTSRGDGATARRRGRLEPGRPVGCRAGVRPRLRTRVGGPGALHARWPRHARRRGRSRVAPRPARGARFRPAPSRRRHGTGVRPLVVPEGTDLAAVGVARRVARGRPAARARARRGRPARRRVVVDDRRRPGPVRRQRRGPRRHRPRPARPPRQRGHVGPVVPLRSRLPGRAGLARSRPPPPSRGCCRSCRCSAPCRRPPTTRRSCMPWCWLPCSSASGSGAGSTPSSSSSATCAPG